MKKLIICFLLIATLCGCSANQKPVLKVYNTGEYIDKTLISSFEKEFDCKVVYETFDSNESMYTKLLSGEQYDVIIPSDYMIERLIKEDYLAPIDWSKITNKENLMPEVLNKDYDKDSTYSVPYFWGTVGILYNKNVVDENDLKEGWELLKNPKYNSHLYMYDSERDSFMVALKALGYSMNTDNTDELDEAYNWLIEQRQTMNPIYIGDEVIDNMISGNKDIAIVYSGDASYIITENPELDYYTPDEGTNIWYDAMVITKTCTNSDLAHSFVNFMIDQENALKNSEAVGYSSTVTSAYNEMKETVYSGIEAYTPRVGYEKDEVFRYQNTNVKKYCSELWVKVKSK